MSTPTPLAGEAQRQVNLRLGPWASGFRCSRTGALLTQFIQYYALYPRDKIYLKTAVAGLCLLTILKSAQSFAIIWNHAIIFFGNLQGAIQLNFTTWWETGNPLMVAVIGSYVQAYFCYRLYAISGSIYVVAPLAAIFLFALVAMAVATYFITVQDIAKIPVWFNAHLSSVFAGDLLLTSTTTYFLLRSRRRALPQSEALIGSLLRLTFRTAAPAALCAMLNLIVSVRFTGDKALFSLVFNMPLPKLYAISMMFTLNARHRIRLSGRSGQYGSSSGGRSGPVKSPRAPNDVELGPIQVFTPTQTEKRIRATLGRDIHKGRREIKDFGREDIKSAPEFT
ncbi:hypothetical protein DFH08DRAFT_969042 [Mycena albidolilacea]|uniref:DUF6534 domain-containing protein n=1 Tax=Mycena albidolilacea TaxID=1033008 RepID=A0AAD6ZIP2_9AGAR|nr:hypothetical protein DFH08DRAFT_969042 [Mycena albidolilacea]